MKRLASLALLGIIISLHGLAHTGTAAATQNGPVTITVPGTAVLGPNGTPPVDSGVVLAPGMAAVVSATGVIGLCGPGCNESGPDGDQRYAEMCSDMVVPVPDYPPFTLMAQVGDSPILHAVGTGPRLVAGDGPLRFFINDCYAENNSGAFELTIATTASAVSTGQAQSSCRGRAEPVISVVEWEVYIPAYVAEAWTEILATERRTTTTNYNGVEGLIQIVTEVPHNMGTQTITALSIPQWLFQVYNGSESAIRSDLEAGLLKDRGPCV